VGSSQATTRGLQPKDHLTYAQEKARRPTRCARCFSLQIAEIYSGTLTLGRRFRLHRADATQGTHRAFGRDSLGSRSTMSKRM